jgi:hypothetical protein
VTTSGPRKATRRSSSWRGLALDRRPECAPSTEREESTFRQLGGCNGDAVRRATAIRRCCPGLEIRRDANLEHPDRVPDESDVGDNRPSNRREFSGLAIGIRSRYSSRISRCSFAHTKSKMNSQRVDTPRRLSKVR